MIGKRRMWIVLSMMLAATLALSGCGGSSQNANGEAPGGKQAGSTGESANTPADAKLAAQYKKLNMGHPLEIATDFTLGIPWAVKNQDGSETGVSVDLARAIAGTLGAQADIKQAVFDTIIPGLAAKRYDFAITGMGDTPERQQQIDFVDYILGGSAFGVLKTSDLKDKNLSLDTICGMQVGSQRGTIENGYLNDASKKCVADGKKPIDMPVFDQQQQALLALKSQRVPAILTDVVILKVFGADPNNPITTSGEPIHAVLAGIALPKGSDLVPLVRDALQHLMDDGTYQKIMKANGVEDLALTKATVNKSTP